MALVDWEAVALDLERHFLSKNSFGQRELLAKLAELRSTHRQPEGLVERAGRLYLPELTDELMPAGRGDEDPPGHDRDAHPIDADR
jgi:hypothetical protein